MGANSISNVRGRYICVCLDDNGFGVFEGRGLDGQVKFQEECGWQIITDKRND